MKPFPDQLLLELAKQSNGKRSEVFDRVLLEQFRPEDRPTVRAYLRLPPEFSDDAFRLLQAVEWCERQLAKTSHDPDDIARQAAKTFGLGEGPIITAWLEKKRTPVNRLRRVGKLLPNPFGSDADPATCES